MRSERSERSDTGVGGAVAVASLGVRGRVAARAHHRHNVKHQQAREDGPDEKGKRDGRLGRAAPRVVALGRSRPRRERDGAREPENRRHSDEAERDQLVKEALHEHGRQDEVGQHEQRPHAAEDDKVDNVGRVPPVGAGDCEKAKSARFLETREQRSAAHW